MAQLKQQQGGGGSGDNGEEAEQKRLENNLCLSKCCNCDF